MIFREIGLTDRPYIRLEGEDEEEALAIENIGAEMRQMTPVNRKRRGTGTRKTTKKKKKQC